MNILVDDRWFGDTGIGRYAREVLERKPASVRVNYLKKGWKIKNPASPWMLGRTANRSSADLFWSPGFMPPALCRVPYVVTIHDLIHLHYGTSLHRVYYNQVIRRLLRDATFVLTDSSHSRDEIVDWSGLPPDKVRVVPLAVSDEFSAAGDVFNPGYPYVLYVGNRRIYKNIHRLIKAFGIACRNSGIKLALSGTADPDLLNLANQAGVADQLVFLGRIEERLLPAVYRGARAVAYVSLYEGFGLPPLEAMACGTPVLTSNVTSLPEVVGDAGLTVDPLDVEQIANGLKRILRDESLRNELTRKGNERIKMFSWDICALKTWDVLSQAALK